MDQITEERRIVLSTDDFDDHDRDGLVRDFYGRISMRLDLAPLEGGQLRLTAATTVLPGMSVTQGAVAPMSWDRTTALMADANDDIAVSWMAGGYRFDRRGRATVEIAPGAACVMPFDQAWRAMTPNGERTVCVQLSRSLLAPLVDDLDDIAPDAINPLAPEGQLLMDYVSAVSRTPVSPGLAPLASQHIADLVALALGTGPETRRAAEERGGAAARLRALKQHVAENLHSPRLSAETAGRSLNLSPRYIRRLFATEGMSFSDYVTERRLEWVSRRLSDPRHAYRPIADIAFEAGWAEPSTFYRQFKARYGVKPSDARARPTR